MSFRARLLAFLHVPHEPSAPAGDDDIRIFRAAPNYFYYRVARWVLKNSAGLVGLFVGVSFLRNIPERFDNSAMMLLFTVMESAAIAGFAIQAAWTLALLRLDFEQRWYIVSDRSLRIREGLVSMHEKTMTFANIQHVTIRQGPLQRLLGIADLEVRTAGGGGGSPDDPGEKVQHDLHVAYFRGVAEAAAIRETIRERLRRHADAGLGDPDDVESSEPPLLAAAHALSDEARALRQAVS